MPSALRTWTIRDTPHSLGRFPWLMGIVNVTPDSFSDGGKYFIPGQDLPELAVEQGLRLAAEGAEILDIGGESTRPGATPVPEDDELRRVVPVIQQLAERTDRWISIDTTKARVAREALAAGADIVNDISGLQFDAHMPDVCAETRAGVVCMHIQGTPQTMQQEPRYEDVLHEVAAFLRSRLADLQSRGVSPERVVFDPGIGFGKTAEHNLQLLSGIATLRDLGRPVLVGHSRKRFLKKVLQHEIDELTYGTVGITLALAAQSTDIIRVHDVRASRDALLAWQAVMHPAAENSRQ